MRNRIHPPPVPEPMTVRPLTPSGGEPEGVTTDTSQVGELTRETFFPTPKVVAPLAQPLPPLPPREPRRRR